MAAYVSHSTTDDTVPLRGTMISSSNYFWTFSNPPASAPFSHISHMYVYHIPTCLSTEADNNLIYQITVLRFYISSYFINITVYIVHIIRNDDNVRDKFYKCCVELERDIVWISPSLVYMVYVIGDVGELSIAANGSSRWRSVDLKEIARYVHRMICVFKVIHLLFDSVCNDTYNKGRMKVSCRVSCQYSTQLLYVYWQSKYFNILYVVQWLSLNRCPKKLLTNLNT